MGAGDDWLMQPRLVLFPLGIFLLSVSSALASLAVVDQQNTVGGTATSVGGLGTGPGQSFTPNLSSVNAADFSLSSFDASAVTIQLHLFAGSGYAGLLLGSSASVTFTGTNSRTVEFNFPFAIA